MASNAFWSDWATVDYQSEYQSVDVWLTSHPEDDEYHRSELGRNTFGPGLSTYPPSLAYAQVGGEVGYGTHSGDSRHCHFQAPNEGNVGGANSAEAGAAQLSRDIYLPVGIPLVRTQGLEMASGVGERGASMPPALERYVHDHQDHEALATGYSRFATAANGQLPNRESHQKNAHQHGSDKGSQAPKRRKGAQRHNTNGGGKQDRTGWRAF